MSRTLGGPFLNEKHERPEYVSPNNNNNYTLGRVGKHNIVITVLPNGEYGISSTASVARDILHSFPNVRIGLIVGIGGSALSLKHNIRLGDIVVSAPRDRNSGPLVVLWTALKEAINGILEKKLKLRKNYKRPDLIVHPLNNEVSYLAVYRDNLLSLILRPKRTKEEDSLAIYYGLIMSGNQLIAEKNILYFKMEAVGLITHFLYLVIRGIYNYLNSYKNKEWQGYIVIAAAIYAKGLLY
ncbi:nucleoside phosphorylase domain-containing protein [Cenococcum geophilum]